jgi:GNAT superfamily N-acetyltransferase
MPLITLKKATEADLLNFDKIREEKLPKLHSQRLKEQKTGQSEYMIAFEGDKPVGHVYINYKGEEPYHTCPILQDLYVKKDVRRHGIAKEILNQISKYIEKKGYLELGMDVNVENEWIKNFYEQVSFLPVDRPHKQSWIEEDSGKKINIVVYHLRKKLR